MQPERLHSVYVAPQIPPLLLWDDVSSGGSSSIHWLVVQWLWRKVLRKVEDVTAALLLQTGTPASAGHISGWCRRPPALLVLVDDGAEPLGVVGDRVRQAAAAPLPISDPTRLPDLMIAAIEEINPMWTPLESEALRDKMAQEEALRQQRTVEAQERQRKRQAEGERKRAQELKSSRPAKKRRSDRKRKLAEAQATLREPDDEEAAAEGTAEVTGEGSGEVSDVDRRQRKKASGSKSKQSEQASESEEDSEEEDEAEEEEAEEEPDDAALAAPETQRMVDVRPRTREAARGEEEVAGAAGHAEPGRSKPVVPVPEADVVQASDEEEEPGPRMPSAGGPGERLPEWKRHGLTGPPGAGQALKGPKSRNLVPKPRSEPCPDRKKAPQKSPFSLGVSQDKPTPAPGDTPAATPAATAPSVGSRAPSPSAPFRPPATVTPPSAPVPPAPPTASSLLPPEPLTKGPYKPAAKPLGAKASPKPPHSPAPPASPEPKPHGPKPAAVQSELQARLARHHDPAKKPCRDQDFGQGG